MWIAYLAAARRVHIVTLCFSWTFSLLLENNEKVDRQKYERDTYRVRYLLAASRSCSLLFSEIDPIRTYKLVNSESSSNGGCKVVLSTRNDHEVKLDRITRLSLLQRVSMKCGIVKNEFCCATAKRHTQADISINIHRSRVQLQLVAYLKYF